jgi:hypothetical protein
MLLGKKKMKKNLLSRIAAILCIVSIMLINGVLLPAPIVYGQSKQPQTVVDYFKLLPLKYLSFLGKERKSFFVDHFANIEQLTDSQKVDIKNGYIYFQDSAEDFYQIVLFKKPDNSYLIAVIYSGAAENKQGDLIDVTDFYFLEYRKGQWYNVTRKYLPIPFNKYHFYYIKNNVTAIDVWKDGDHAFEDDKRLYELQWQNGKFIAKRISQATK